MRGVFRFFLLLALFAIPYGTAVSAKAVSTTVELDRSVILESGDSRRVYALIRLETPRELLEDEDRPPLNIALVLDRSGSMADKGKLEFLKKAAALVVDSLEPRDTISVVEYDDEITVMFPAASAEPTRMIKLLIDELEPRGSTNLVGGMMRGVEEVKRGATLRTYASDPINRVLLLSDGLANEGVTEPSEIRNLVRQAKYDGAPISTLGLGRDYDEDLMQHIAENAGGRYYYVEHPNQISRIFAQELKTLFRTVARNCEIRFNWGEHVNNVEILGASVQGDESSSKVEMEDFFSGESRSILVRLDVAPEMVGSLELGEVEFAYLDVSTGKEVAYATSLTVEVSTDQNAVDQSENRNVVVEAALVESEKAHQEAVKLYEDGKHDEADAKMANLAVHIESENVKLNDKRLSNKLEAVNIEREEMKEVALAPGEQSEYLKRTKQRLYKAQKGQRALYLLQEGDHGFEVERLQEALTSTGHYSGPVNGEYDASLSDAVTAFQQSRNIGSDGVVGPATMKELGLY
jgi:Ca-activated chloride channel family protein